MNTDVILADNGLQLQAVLDVPDVLIALPKVAAEYDQLLVFAHGGSCFWDSLLHPLSGDHPLDTASVRLAEDYLGRIDCAGYLIVYPSMEFQLDLRSLGRQLGWHADSPLGIGINASFGTWWAYRVAVLANTSLELNPNNLAESPCDSCVDKPCIKACPVGAVGARFDLEACMNERTREGSDCAYQCLARNVCPVGAQHRYKDNQMHYHYGMSLKLIKSPNSK